MLSLMVASSGMMFSLVPACSEPTVSTALSSGETSRETIVCSRITVAAAITTGSIEVCGCEPCEPRPNSVTCRLSPADRITPARYVTVPAGPTITCWPRITSGRGSFAPSQSATIAFAPCAVSSPGWNTTSTVPRHASRASASTRAAPSIQAT
jgi:hypothetical protein